MNRLAFGAALAVLGALAGPLAALEPAPSPAAKPWYKRIFGSSPDPVVPPKPEKRDPAAEAATARARAESELSRRQSIVNELRTLAFENNNPQLDTKADEIEREAWEVYRKQTAHLPCNKLMPTPEEKALDRKLGTSVAADEAPDKLTTPAINVSNRGTQASATRGVKP